ncbi:MAG: aldo/keto reductase [Acholeplasma sp.]|nr:MAG: aldo/keto reductase [Acholeplasma sp.]
MGYNEYAHTKHKINRLGFGGWQLGNTEFWGYMAIEDGVELVQHAIKRGINFFDTAPGYASGLSETILGMATKNLRSKVVINTKLGHTADGETDFSVYSLRKQIEDSLERLQTTYLDSVILHNPGFDILEGKTQHVQELKALKEEGLIRAFGVSIDTYEELDTVIHHLDVDVVEILFNIFFQEPAKLFKKAAKKGISLIAKVPLDSGWLTGKYDENSEFTGIRMRWDDQTIERRAQLVANLKEMTKEENLTKYAIAFILSFPEITAVIPGMRTIDQVNDHLANADFKLTQALKDQFIKLYETKIKDEPLPW